MSMKWILALTLSWWCDLYPDRGTRPTLAVMYYGEIMNPYAYSQQYNVMEYLQYI